MKSVNQEYNLGEGSLGKWIRDYSEECETNPELNNEKDQMAEILKLRKELAEAKKQSIDVVQLLKTNMSVVEVAI